MPHWNNQPWQRNLNKTASGKTGRFNEPEILRYLNRQFCPIGADAGHHSDRGSQYCSTTTIKRCATTACNHP